MDSFVPPLYEEVYTYFMKKVNHESVAESMSRRFFEFYTKNNWQIKISANRMAPMKSWKGTINTWCRNLPKYNKPEHVKLVSKRIFDEA